jgi:hypothetical protein
MPEIKQTVDDEILFDVIQQMIQRYYLPHWASASLEGEWVQFAQLATRDGRKMGNAVILAVDTVKWGDKLVDLYTIFTDFGNVLRLTEEELAVQFYAPKWQVKANRVSHRVKHISSYAEWYME